MNWSTAFFLALSIIVATPFAASAQDRDNSAQGDGSTTSLQPGATALQFQISNNFDLDSFSGTAFSYKQQLSEDRARRIGVSLDNSYRRTNLSENADDLERSSLDLGVGIDYTWMHYTNPDQDIKFFYGYGPGVNVGVRRQTDTRDTSEETRQVTSYGVSGIGYAGVEWFFQPAMSLHAEYRGSLEVNHTREERELEGNGMREVSEINTTTIRLGGNGVRFGLSVYF
ncbi:hypothetical protein [Salisaeta longa]|uniref:hypothetical protein n=1 Tax=Salisaeta longa TaxID=503170 RepID=UPI0012FA9AEB|nr:hypothetical protein [Salisaeta longa]